MNSIQLKYYDTLRPPGMGSCQRLGVHHDSFRAVAKKDKGVRFSEVRFHGDIYCDCRRRGGSALALEVPGSQEKNLNRLPVCSSNFLAVGLRRSSRTNSSRNYFHLEQYISRFILNGCFRLSHSRESRQNRNWEENKCATSISKVGISG
jgi:hypothetical protein